MAKSYRLTHETLLSVLDFDPATGVFVWKIARSNRVKPGSRAGVLHAQSGGRYISIDGEKFMAHRLAFFFVNKRWPNTDVRPNDGDYDNCAISNLTEVSRVELAHSRRSIVRNNTSGLTGVSRTVRGKWQASVTWNYKQISLGANFDTPEAAGEVHDEAIRRLAKTKTASEQDSVLEGLRVWKGQRTAWVFLQRSHADHLWVSFEHFCRDVTSVPVMRYAMIAIDPVFPIGPGNFRWAFPPEASRQTPAGREIHNRVRRDDNRAQMRDRHIRMKYRIGAAEEYAFLNAQFGVCAICERDKAEGDAAFSVDHDHNTQKVRGLLCRQCNYAMGQFGDNPRLLRRAVDYLEIADATTWDTPAVTEITHLPAGQGLLMEAAGHG